MKRFVLPIIAIASFGSPPHAQEANPPACLMVAQTDHDNKRDIFYYDFTVTNVPIQSDAYYWIVAIDDNFDVWPQVPAKLGSGFRINGQKSGEMIVGGDSSYPLEFVLVELSREQFASMDADTKDRTPSYSGTVEDLKFASKSCFAYKGSETPPRCEDAAPCAR